MTLLLASTSPRRADLLHELGLPFAQVDSGLDDAAEARLQAACGALPPERLVRRLALAKLLAAARAHPGRALLAADTLCHLEGRVVGKAADRAQAAAILEDFRARTHEILTGLALLAPDGRLRVAVATSRVAFRDFDRAALEAYLDTGLWRGKAGAYGEQDPESAALIAEVQGSRSNVRGLPLESLRALLAELGLPCA